MAFGIDTFGFHLDLISDSDWDDFRIWNGGKLVDGKTQGGDPLFAGRNFLGGDFIWGHSEATNSSTELNGKLAATDPSPSHPENLQLRVPLVAPIQAPHQPPREDVTGERGFLYGAIDAEVLCSNLLWSMYCGEFALNQNEQIQVWLTVNPEITFSLDYWAGWADRVYSFSVFLPIGSFHPVKMLQPFYPCIRCHYSVDQTGKFRRDPNVNSVLDNVGAQYPTLHTKCYHCWADTVEDDESATRPNPAIDWKQFDPTQLPIPILWRFSNNLEKSDGSGLNTMFSVDAVKDPKDPPAKTLKATDFMLIPNKWQPNPDSIISVGFSITDEMTAARVRCVQNTSLPAMADNGAHFTVKGGPTVQVGRYIRIRPVDSMGLDEAQRLSEAGFEIFTTWESFNVAANAQPKVIGYFNPAFHAGTEDGKAAFSYCGDVLHQPSQTPVYFCVDFDAPHDEELDLPMAAGHDAARRRTQEAWSWIVNYFNLVRAERDAYARKNPDRYYLIGVYAGGEVLRWLYKEGLASHFWQAVSFLGTGSTPPRWPWYHANRWQYQFQDADHALPERWDCVGGADPDAEWGDGGGWRLTDSLNQRLTTIELAEELLEGVFSRWGNLVNPGQ